ncbi:MAG: pyridoxal 5'-phosphate synthase glutaminase subunit PdxT [Anaerolineaceae bacterium]|nr:pyridoxal 5'-phosphate synthase glutaminase subunit PdxT [Anaerolineaceae bacterium]MBN2678229.1 pyridoxal 5'-phosphate synthase glutaminase subunit PdxT [Anaerolineaceae bacterium]
MRIGVLALQGAFIEHIHMLSGMGVETVAVRLPAELGGLDGLIIPGGESTTIGKLAVAYGLIDPLRSFGQNKPIWGTCAGAILLAKEIRQHQPLLGLMDIVVARNAFGRQLDSFVTPLDVPALLFSKANNPPFPAVFIRAPIIDSISGDARVLASLPDGRIVAVRQKHLLATSFHPELTNDNRFHQYFSMMVAGKV